MAMQCLSEYAENLPSDAKARYKEKLDVIGGIDPFQPRNFGELDDRLPDVDGSDLVSYLVLQTSFITANQFKARKSLEAYNQFVSGWVKDVCNRKVRGKHLITARVSYFVTNVILFALLTVHICNDKLVPIIFYLRFDIHRE